jgi:hypothetical protein
MFAWVFTNGSISGTHTPADLCQLIADHGYKWWALERDDPNFRDANLAVWDQCVEHSHLRGLKFGPWFTEGGNLYETPPDADLAIAEVEGPGDLEGVTNVPTGLGAGPAPTCPIAICTNFSTLNRDNCKPLIQRGVTCLTESYMNESPGMTPDNMDGVAKFLGWPTSQPVFGVYPTASTPHPDYSQWADWPGVDYLGEFML